jgi:hypothetical protein
MSSNSVARSALGNTQTQPRRLSLPCPFDRHLSAPFILRQMTQRSKPQTNMIQDKFIAIIAVTWAFSAVSSLNAATIPAGTTLAVQTAGSISSSDPVGRTFEAKLDQDVAVKGNVLLKARTKAFGRIKSSGANPRKSEPLSLELTSLSVNGSNVAVKTNSVQPTGRPSTAGAAGRGVTVGTLRVGPGTKMQFQLAKPVTF